MNIIIPVLGFGNSGGYRVLSNLATELIKLGHRVDFLSPGTTTTPYFPTKAGILWIKADGTLSRNAAPYPVTSNAISLQLLLKKALRQKEIETLGVKTYE